MSRRILIAILLSPFILTFSNPLSFPTPSSIPKSSSSKSSSKLTRRTILPYLLSPFLLPLSSSAANVVDTRFDPLSYLDPSTLNSQGGSQAQPVGVGTMSSRARPVTGVKVIEGSLYSSWEDNGKSKKNPNQITCEVELGTGTSLVGFSSPWTLKRGMFYDVETRGESGDGSYLQVGKSPPSEDVEIGQWIFSTVTAQSGRFGANGGATLKSIQPVKTVQNSEGDTFKDVVFYFDTLSPSMRELPRRVRVRCSWPPRKGECCMLVLQGGVGESYKKSVKPIEEEMMER